MIDSDGMFLLKKGVEFIFLKKVMVFDVIYLWENGLGDMFLLC